MKFDSMRGVLQFGDDERPSGSGLGSTRRRSALQTGWRAAKVYSTECVQAKM